MKHDPNFDSPFTLHLVLTGRVQGVGFRPFVYRLAREMGLAGRVHNTPEGVEILVQGNPETVETFSRRLHTELPPLAHIAGIDSSRLEDQPLIQGFSIDTSTSGQGHNVQISPDIATCQECGQEILDPCDPRYLYPFTNCTNCGPRYTITRGIPYDRANTSMACFSLCPGCEQEYFDPQNRRFHAQPNACPVCGPGLWSADPDGAILDQGNQALNQTARALAQGRIVAIKGLGGFHLACLACDHSAVQVLRQRKSRPSKPLAVMVPDLQTAEHLAHLTPADKSWLTGMIKPIVLVRRNEEAGLPDCLAPDTESIGLMLPYTPLHQVLLHKLQDHLPQDLPPALVMTSGNAGGEPIVLSNRDSLNRLSSIADLFLLHNRDILVRCDDSVLRTLPEGKAPLFLRRARGFAPSPIGMSQKGPSVLGLGPELKATVCLTKEDQAFVSQHIGDLNNLPTLKYYQDTIQHLQDILQIAPQALITDLHPDFLSTRYAAEHDKLPVFALQHHVAHILAVLAENRCRHPVLGLTLDGTGLGDDHTLWGGEIIYVNQESLEYRRLGHFSPLTLPGGDTAVIEPWRTAQSLLYSLGIKSPENRPWPWLNNYAQASEVVGQMLKKKINCISSTSCGRLFDAVSALLGLCQRTDYEGQAAIRLEAIQARSEGTAYECPVVQGQDGMTLNTSHLFSQVYSEWISGIPAPAISRRFHLGLIQGLADWALALSQQTGIQKIAISGGVFQNVTLANRLPAKLENYGLIPLMHRFLPPNDACISLGQALYGQSRLRRN
ncbi:MAG: carbamoyltransferase HypF [Desulfovermiculus sp.]